jgi:ubiquinone/menaquinone biosynthesis C-methylase UbiE
MSRPLTRSERSVTARPTAQEVKACCVASYGSDLMTLLLGDSYHPGGLALTRHLARLLDLAPAASVLDVASGRGTTALLLAGEHGVRVDGLDLAASNVARAQTAAEAAGLSDRVTFTAGDAERLPYPDNHFDAVVCECAFCTFPDKPSAVAEMVRVLHPGGRLGITDVTADQMRLPPKLTGLAAWAACVADARPADEYVDLLTEAGLRVRHTETHDDALVRMVDQIEARLRLHRMTGRAIPVGVDLGRAPTVLAAVREAIANGVLGYTLLTAEKSA